MILRNGMVFYNGVFKKLDIEIQDKYICNLGDNLSGDDEINIEELKVIPGIIDIHTHGCMGYDFTTANKQGINTMLDYYIRNGITSILATVMTDSKSKLEKAMIEIESIIIENSSENGEIAKNNIIRGINLEGPFFQYDKRGAHNEKYLMDVNEDFFDSLNKYSGGRIKIVTIDPNLKGGVDFINKYKEDIVVSIGHTSCDYELGKKSVISGANHITHLFNAMNSMHHRDSGLIGVFSDYLVTGELICDGIHIDESVIRMIYKVAGERVVIISDSIMPTGLGAGKYISGGMEVIVQDDVARLSDGTIAGSISNCFEGMKKAIEYGVPEEYAILSATLIPAKVIKLDHEIGSIEVGKVCDLVLVDEKYNIKKIIKNGDIIEDIGLE